MEEQQKPREERLKENLRALARNVQLPVSYHPLIEPGSYGPAQNLREGTRLHRYFVNFILNEGGLGDYLNYSVALIWIKKNAPWIDGRLFLSQSFVPLFRHIFDTHGVDWNVSPGEEAGKLIEPGTPVIGPEIRINGNNINPQLLNPIGAHLIDLGFAYYANRCPAPEGAMLPRISFEQNKIPHKIRHLRGKYIVFPLGTLTPARFVSGDHLNPLINHVKNSGFTPVFLGKKNPVSNLNTIVADDLDFSGGIDLREQTDLMTGAAVMHHSAGVCGIDGGFLHLAACTDAPVLFGYSIAGPEQRQPRRNWSRTWNFSATKEDIACANCQVHLKLMLGHTFHKCLYKDNKCIDILFLDKQKLWIDALTDCFLMWQDKHALDMIEPEESGETV